MSMLRASMILALMLLLLPALASRCDASTLPRADQLQQQLAAPPVAVEVVEPHLIAGGRRPHVTYLGYPAPRVLAALFGKSWRDNAAYVEFSALDGYVSRIPVQRFDRYPAYLVFRSSGARPFSVDNLQQHQARVSLAPYYLVWDNIRHPELIADGATYWPYQISAIRLLQAQDVAPGWMTERSPELEKYCLSCHHVRGFGGNKVPQDLAVQARNLGREKFLAWVLTPAAVQPGTGMPALAPAMPQAERDALAKKLFNYLDALPSR